jgi:cold shock protein
MCICTLVKTWRKEQFQLRPRPDQKIAIASPSEPAGLDQPQGGGRDVFVHISAVERAGLSTLNEGQQIEYEIEENRGKTSAVNLKVK